MNTITDSAVSAAACLPAAAAAAAEAKLGQRLRNIQAFQQKYDAMLYLVEFIANYQPIDTASIQQQKHMAELRQMVSEARGKLKALNSAAG
jgi:hypothetical protein